MQPAASSSWSAVTRLTVNVRQIEVSPHPVSPILMILSQQANCCVITPITIFFLPSVLCMSRAFIQQDNLWLVYRTIIRSSIMTFHGGHQLQSCNLQHLTSDIILSLKESQLLRLEKWFNFRPNLGMELCTLRDKLYNSEKVTC